MAQAFGGQAAVAQKHGHASLAAGGQKTRPQLGFQQQHGAGRGQSQGPAHKGGFIQGKKTDLRGRKAGGPGKPVRGPLQNLAALFRAGGQQQGRCGQARVKVFGRAAQQGPGEVSLAARGGLYP